MNQIEQRRLKWRKSSRSNAQYECVELAAVEGGLAVRDSKEDGKGDVLFFASDAAQYFIRSVKSGALDR